MKNELHSVVTWIQNKEGKIIMSIEDVLYSPPPILIGRIEVSGIEYRKWKMEDSWNQGEDQKPQILRIITVW